MLKSALSKFAHAMLPTAVVCAVPAAMPFEAAHALDAYAWKYRPLVVIAPNAGDTQLSAQKAMLDAATSGLAERDVAIVEVVGDSVSVRFGPNPGVSAAMIRRRFGVARDEFAVILVGKDSGAKLKSETPVTAARVFGIIDVMPMRQQEMRR